MDNSENASKPIERTATDTVKSETYKNSGDPPISSDQASAYSLYSKDERLTLTQKSTILSFLSLIAAAMVRMIESSAVVRFLMRDNTMKEAFGDSRILGFFRSGRFKVFLIRLKHSLLRQMNSSILSGRESFGSAMLNTTMRYYGAFLISMAFTCCLVYRLDAHYLGHFFNPTASQPYICIPIFIFGAAFMILGKTPDEHIRSSFFLRIILFSFFGVNLSRTPSEPTKRSYSATMLAGIVIGAFSLFIPLSGILIILALILCGIIILKSPETGVIMVIVSLFFLPFNYACVLTGAVWVSFIIKFISGKRIMKFEYIDLIPFAVTLILALGGIFSLGKPDFSAMLPAILSTIYFLVAGLIHDRLWAGRFRVTLTCCGVVSAVALVIRKLPDNPLGMAMKLFPASDMGSRTDSVFENSGILTLILAMLFFLQLANFYSRKKTSEKLGHFALCAFFAAVLLTELEVLPAMLFVGLTLFATLLLAKGLRFFIPLTAVFLIVAPIFGFPTVIQLFTEAGKIIAEKAPIWEEYALLIKEYGYNMAIYGIGVRKDAVDMIYSGVLTSADPKNMILWTAISLGIPTTLFVILSSLPIIKYCFSHCRRCSEKTTPSRLHTYGGMLSVGYMVIMGATECVWYNYRCAAIFWIILGFTLSVQRYSVGDTSQGYINDHMLIPEI